MRLQAKRSLKEPSRDALNIVYSSIFTPLDLKLQDRFYRNLTGLTSNSFQKSISSHDRWPYNIYVKLWRLDIQMSIV